MSSEQRDSIPELEQLHINYRYGRNGKISGGIIDLNRYHGDAKATLVHYQIADTRNSPQKQTKLVFIDHSNRIMHRAPSDEVDAAGYSAAQELYLQDLGRQAEKLAVVYVPPPVRVIFDALREDVAVRLINATYDLGNVAITVLEFDEPQLPLRTVYLPNKIQRMKNHTRLIDQMITQGNKTIVRQITH